MPGKVLTLYEICMDRTAVLLKESYWCTNFPIGSNEFHCMPSSMINSLIIRVIQKSLIFPLESANLKHLLTSGQVTEFILEDVNVNSETLQEILLDLSSACEKLIKIKIRKVYCNIVHRLNLHMKKYAFNCLLREARNVRYVESCIEFDLDALANSNQLEKLVLNFPPTSHIYDFLEIGGQLMYHSSLKSLEVFEDPRHPVSYVDIAMVLQYCIQLMDINCDIAKSLEYLHTEELFNGTLNRIYKLQKCCLGSMHEHWSNGAATRDAVYIASLTCPDLKDVSLLANEDEVICALSDFHNLTSLLIQWEKVQFGDYTLGVQSLLQKPEIGHQLTTLDIINFTNIDFSSIGACCPNLRTLRVEYKHENNRNKFSDTSFRFLTQLMLENIADWDCEVNTLVGILSNATDLRSLGIVYAGQLTDEILRNILRKNSLSNVKELRLARCVLTVRGIKILVSSLSALEYFDIGETSFNLDEIAAVIHEINPCVIVSSTSDDF